MKNITLFFMLLFFLSSFAWAGNKAAVVKIIRGEAFVISGSGKAKLKANDWIEAGSTIKTSAKSFLKLVFIDKSQMNIGASSEIKVEKFHSKDAGVLDLVKGKIRSQVTKDYLQMDGKNKSKLFIKTPNAVMGIRGTDFLITTTGKNTVAILFEGSVVFNRLSDRSISDSAKLDDIVDQGVRMFPGEFSAVGDKGAPTLPALLNVQQKEKLEKNASFAKNDKSAAKTKRSIVPEGLSRKVVSSKPSIDLQKKNGQDRSSSNPDSYSKNGQIKPANGSFVLIDSARVIQPGSDAIFDEASNTYVASNKLGDVKVDGTFAPSSDINTKFDSPIVSLDVDKSLDTSARISTPVLDPSTTLNTVSGPVAGATSSDAQTVQITDTLNDVVNSVPVVGPTASGVTEPTGDVVDGAVDTTTGVVNDTVGGVGRLIGIKK